MEPVSTIDSDQRESGNSALVVSTGYGFSLPISGEDKLGRE
jgi:hypothetical protein